MVAGGVWKIDLEMARAYGDWVPATGTITKFRIVSNSDYESFWGEIRIEYQVDEKKHTTLKALRKSSYPVKRDLAKFLKTHYPVGGTVELYYNPERPYENSLERPQYSFLFSGITVSCLAAGCVLMAMAVSGFRKKTYVR